MKRFVNMDKMSKVRFWRSFPQKGKETNLMEMVSVIAEMYLEAEAEGCCTFKVKMPLKECGGIDGAIFNRDALFDWLVKHKYSVKKIGDMGLQFLMS